VFDRDWVASAQDDLVLIPRTEATVHQGAFATLKKLNARRVADMERRQVIRLKLNIADTNAFMQLAGGRKAIADSNIRNYSIS
jgi:hypothetical protein